MDRRDFLKAGSVAAVMTTGALGAKAATKASTSDAEISRYAPTSLTPEYYFDQDKQLVENPEQRFAFSKCFGCFNVCGARVSIEDRKSVV